MIIEDFIGEYFFLSNFYPCKVIYAEYEFPSVENAYRAASVGYSYFEEFFKISPYEANRLGRLLGQRDDFHQTKYMVMKDLVVQKFKNLELRKKLVATGDKRLINLTRFKDYYWGSDYKGMGLNKLGDILMELRNDYKELINV